MGRFFLIPCAVAALALPKSGAVFGNSEQLAKAPLADVETIPVLRGVPTPERFENDDKSEEDSAGLVEAQPRRLNEPQVSQCSFSASPTTLTVSVSPYTLEAKFSCGEKSGSAITVDPNCTSQTANCCGPSPPTADGDCPKQTISAAAGVNGSAVMDSSSNVVTVKLEGTPTTADGKLYFKCKKDQNACIVTVNMPDALTASQCNFNKNVSLPAISEPNKKVTFQCGGTAKTLADDTQVFNGPECTGNASRLSDLVPGAQLTKDKDGTFTLSVAALPSDTQNLCFKCIYPDPTKPDTDATCKVTVGVSGTSKTTTASTTTSGAEVITVTSFAALAIACFSAAGGVY